MGFGLDLFEVGFAVEGFGVDFVDVFGAAGTCGEPAVFGGDLETADGGVEQPVNDKVNAPKRTRTNFRMEPY